MTREIFKERDETEDIWNLIFKLEEKELQKGNRI